MITTDLDIIKNNILSKFEEDWAKNVAQTNILSKFEEDWAKNVAPRVLTRFF